MSTANVFERYPLFKSGHTSFVDYECSRHLSSSEIYSLEMVLHDIHYDRCRTIYDFCKILSYGTCSRILTDDLNMRRGGLLQNSYSVCWKTTKYIAEFLCARICKTNPKEEQLPSNFFLFPKTNMQLKEERWGYGGDWSWVARGAFEHQETNIPDMLPVVR
jgi:hypothetical protein